MLDSDDTDLFRAIANTIDPSQPLVRDLANKISNMPEDEINRFIEYGISCIPEAELERLIQPVLWRLGEALFIAISEMFTNLGQQLYSEFVAPASTLFFWGFVATISINCGRSIYQWRSNKQLQSSKVTTNAAKEEQLKPSKKSIFWSKYSTNPDQGLKCVGKIYLQVQETAMDRQEVEQHQEGTSRAFVPSSRSTVDDPKSLW